ncbi:hypothetical protein DL546_004814 [Coniochaeta pulveracea]|uniref:Uncharacterized protein n=1 Tax=Coniochaeta pulveracea TaxID=177199 RepID=A0A420YGX1_9PEZI|nr:hypothetical protein DL546_004814 [Coniochaeta pulveracea]
MSIGAAIGDLVHSFYELFASILGGIYNTFHAIFAAFFGLFNGLFVLIGDVFKGAFDVVGGVGKFLISNIVIVAIVAAGCFAYVRYQQQQGRSVGAAPQKKTI